MSSRHYTSKIYDILLRADLLQNSVPYFYVNEITPQDVVERFISFDKKKCDDFANTQQRRYMEGMEKQMNLLQERI
jgi:hypothetical protein